MIESLHYLLRSYDEKTKIAEFYVRDKSIKIKLDHADDALVICDMMQLLSDGVDEYYKHLNACN